MGYVLSLVCVSPAYALLVSYLIIILLFFLDARPIFHDRGKKCLMLLFPSLLHIGARLCDLTPANNLRNSLLAGGRWRRRMWCCWDHLQKRSSSIKKKGEMSRKSPPFFSIRVPEAEEASVAVRWKARWAVSQKVEVVELKGV